MKLFITLILLSFITFSNAIDLDLSGDQIIISGDFDKIEFAEKLTQNSTFTQLNLRDCRATGKIGEPELPIFSQLIELPNTGNYKLDNISYNEEIIELGNSVLPCGLLDDHDINPSEYQSDKWIPEEIVTISDPNIMGAYRFTQIAVSPIQYNPVQNKLKILKDIDINLSLDNNILKNPKLKENKINSFSSLSAAMILGSRPRISDQKGQYLFIIQDDTAPLLEPLLRWKEKLGYTTRVATLSETGSDSGDIKNFIQNAYDNWEIPPEYVVLVGDVNGTISVPSFYVQGYYTPWDVSDHKYSLLEGDDYFPDVLVGRLSVRSQLQLNTIISKIINYESDPLIEDNWQKKALMMAYVDTWMEFYSARETVMEVRTKLLDFEFTVVDTFISPYQSGMNTITNMINGGYTFINYRGAGGPGYWWGNYGPMYDINAIESLNNGFKLPMVTSIVCGGGDFASTNYPTCFGETWLTAGSPSNPKGAIGFIGPSEIDTKTPFNNANDMGIYQGITQEGVTRCGEMMLRGKMELYNNYPNCHNWGNALNSDQFYFFVYNLLGDPGLQILTDTPKDFDISIPAEIPFGSNFLEVQIELNDEDRSGFTIAITNSDSLITTGITDASGIAAIPIDLTVGSYEVTASKYLFIPVTYELSVVEEEIVRIDEYSCSEVIPGEAVSIAVSIHNSSNTQANNLEIELSTEEDFIEIVTGSSTIASLDANEYTTCNFEIVLDHSWRDGINGDLFLNISSDLGENDFFIPIEIISPQFTISDFIIDESNGNLLQNSNSTFDLEILNSGNFDADETTIEMIAMSENFEVINAETICPAIQTGQTGLIESSFEIEIDDAISGELAKFKFIITNSGNVLQEITYSYPIGEITEESPTFCDQDYIAIESSDIGNFTAPIYDWIEIDPSAGGQGSIIQGGNVNGSDGFTKTIDLPFDFQYFGMIYDEISVCSNGWISMGDTDRVFFRNKNIPSGVGSKAMIAPFWDNLINGNVYSYYDALQNTFIIEWSNVRNYYSYSYEIFQVIFYDPIYYPSINGNGDILFQYKQIQNNDSSDNYATIGIENETQTNGLLITFANIYAPTAHELESETAILFTANGDSQVNVDQELNMNIPTLYQNYPNPFNPTTTISFSLTSKNSEKVELTIYNLKGQKVKQLISSQLPIGQYSIVWDGTDLNDQSVSSGVYFYKLAADGKTIATRKCLLLK